MMGETEVKHALPCEVNFVVNSQPKGPREYIFNLLPRHKPNLISKYKCLPKIRHHKTFDNENKEKYLSKTMGPPARGRLSPVIYPNKRSYLKKQSKNPFIKIQNKDRQCDFSEKNFKRDCFSDKKPQLPTVKGLADNIGEDGIPLKCHRKRSKSMNWINYNAISAITKEPGYRLPNDGKKFIIDSNKGHKYALKSEKTISGLEPVYVYKPDVGKIPNYLIRRKELIHKTQSNLSHYLNEKSLKMSNYLLTKSQREDLLNGLKSAWDKYNRQYLGLASVNDTLKGKAFKLYLEEQLDSLKKDIELIQNHEYLFVEAPKESYNNNDNGNLICA